MTEAQTRLGFCNRVAQLPQSSSVRSAVYCSKQSPTNHLGAFLVGGFANSLVVNEGMLPLRVVVDVKERRLTEDMGRHLTCLPAVQESARVLNAEGAPQSPPPLPGKVPPPLRARAGIYDIKQGKGLQL